MIPPLYLKGQSPLRDKLDNHFRITERVIQALEELESGIDQVIESKKQAMRDAAAEAVGSVIDYAAKEARELAIDTLKHLFERVVPTWPR